jgi:hypothetical protein
MCYEYHLTDLLPEIHLYFRQEIYSTYLGLDDLRLILLIQELMLYQFYSFYQTFS